MKRPVPISSVDESTERSSSGDLADQFSSDQTLLKGTTHSGEHVSPLDPGRYVVDESDPRALLGSGAQGSVWRAHDQVLRREVALKKMHADAQRDPGLVGMFLREARLTASLEHPGIVPLHDLGRDADGRLYLALRRIEGRSLADTLEDAGSLDARLALVPALVRACQAVAFAHEHGVVHRDLKPQNIMLGRFGETYVLDWGLALVEDRRVGTRPDVTAPTQTTGVVGTPAYMSPEQALGLAADARSDVWGLGACLYHLLTGHPPIMGGSLLSAVKHAAAGEISPALAVEPHAPRELAAICEKALSVERSSRYANATALASDLEAWLAGRAVSAREYSAGERLWRAIKSNRATVTAALLGLLALAGVVAFDEARIRTERNDAREFVGRLIRELPTQIGSSHQNVKVLNLLTTRAQEWLSRKDLSISELLAATDTLVTLADANGDVGEWTSARDLYERAFELASQGRALAPDQPVFVARQVEAKAGLGHVASELNDMARATALFQESRALADGWRGEDHEALRLARSELCTKWGNLTWGSDNALAEALFIEGAQAVLPLLQSDTPLTRRTASTRGANAVAALWAQRRHDEAYALARRFYEATRADCALPDAKASRACLLTIGSYVGLLGWRDDPQYAPLLAQLFEVDDAVFEREPDSVAVLYDAVLLAFEHGRLERSKERARALRSTDVASWGKEIGPLAAAFAGDLAEVDAWAPLAQDAVGAGQLGLGLREAARGDYAAAATHVRAVDGERIWFDLAWPAHPRPALKLPPEAQPAFERFSERFTRAYGAADMNEIHDTLEALATDFEALAK
ncbi:MAG: serine/threonine-protein kinase [Archangium sp.]